ncbi:hypothetical protein [Micromonospora sediminimaris]|nr:hypothetical protein [Micromonospora sediminimaris]
MAVAPVGQDQQRPAAPAWGPFAGLRYRFEDYDDDQIRRLRIAP